MRWGMGLCVAALAFAGASAAADYRAPRNAWGRPQLDGAWSNASLTELERPDDFKSLVAAPAEAKAYEDKHRGKTPDIPDDTVGGRDSEWWEMDFGLARIRNQVRTSWITAPADGKLPTTAAAKAAGKARREAAKVNFDNPETRPDGERCLVGGAMPPMMNGGYNDNYQFVLTGDRLAIVGEYNHDVRIVRIGDVRHPPEHIRMRGGDSIGHWEGETLVVDTTNFAPSEVRAPDGDPKADTRVTERFTRTGPQEITYGFMVQQPGRFSQSWRGELVFKPANGAIYEFACHEGNYGLPNILAGARHVEREGGASAASAR